jgi:hypothetical protein
MHFVVLSYSRSTLIFSFMAMSNLFQLFENSSILFYITIIPLLGILLLFFVRDNDKEQAHKIALYTSLITFLLSIFL